MKKIDKVKNYPGWKPKVNLVKEILKYSKNMIKCRNCNSKNL